MLTMFQRAENYVLQNAMGGRSKPYRLTASQQRRIRQGERKALPTGGKVHRKPYRVGLSIDFSGFTSAMKQAHQDTADALNILSTVDDTSDEVFPDEYYVVADKDGNPIDDMPELPECTHTNHCPRCGAVDDEKCVTPAGKATKTHKGRGE